MKKILSAVAVLAVIGGTYAFTSMKHPKNLFQRQIQNPQNCIEANATDFNTGTLATPSSGFEGFYKQADCLDAKITGYSPTNQ